MTTISSLQDEFKNKKIENPQPKNMIELGITFVPQKLRMLNTLSVAENLLQKNRKISSTKSKTLSMSKNVGLNFEKIS